MRYALVNDRKISQKKSFLAFTLVELALVIAVLAVLSFGAFVVSGQILDTARAANIDSHLKSARVAVQLAYQDTNCYAANFNFLVSGIDTDAEDCGTSGTKVSGWDGPYIQSSHIGAGGVIDLDSIVQGTKIEIEAYTHGGKNKLRINLSNTVAGSAVVADIAALKCTNPAATVNDLSLLQSCFYNGGGVLSFHLGK